MKQIVIVICWLLPQYVFARKIECFQTFENWQQILEKAKVENKNILITRTLPGVGRLRKWMQVFSDKTITEFMNTNFISLMIQMDKSNVDLSQVRKWYSEAEAIGKRYNITAYPTRIFLSSSGDLLSVNRGCQNVAIFLSILQKTIDPRKSYTAQVNAYRARKLSDAQLLTLAIETRIA